MKWSLTIVGVVLVVFALVWLLAIFPGMVKLPEDHHREINFEGTYQVMNPDTHTLDTIPVCVQRVQDATDVQDNVLIIEQIVTCYPVMTCTQVQPGMELTQFGLEELLSVDRSTREYVSDQADGMPRSGQFCFPSDLEEESYSMWILNAGRSLEASFIGEEDFHDLKVFAFEIEEQDLGIGTDESTGLPQVVDIDISLKVEPLTGTTVYTASKSTYSVVLPDETKSTYYISDIVFNDDTIDYLVDDASGNRNMILWASVYGFWIAIGVGATLIVTGVVMFVRATR